MCSQMLKGDKNKFTSLVLNVRSAQIAITADGQTSSDYQLSSLTPAERKSTNETGATSLPGSVS